MNTGIISSLTTFTAANRALLNCQQGGSPSRSSGGASASFQLIILMSTLIFCWFYKTVNSHVRWKGSGRERDFSPDWKCYQCQFSHGKLNRQYITEVAFLASALSSAASPSKAFHSKYWVFIDHFSSIQISNKNEREAHSRRSSCFIRNASMR